MVFTFCFKTCKKCKTWTWNLPFRHSLITATNSVNLITEFGPAFHLQTICQQRREGQCEQEGQCAEGAGGCGVGVTGTRPARVLHLFVRDGDVVRYGIHLRVADLAHQKADGQESVSQWRLPTCDVLFLVGQMGNVSFPWFSFSRLWGPMAGGSWAPSPQKLSTLQLPLNITDWKQMFYFYQSCSFPGKYCKQL